jgi:hypothetical protein
MQARFLLGLMGVPVSIWETPGLGFIMATE